MDTANIAEYFSQFSSAIENTQYTAAEGKALSRAQAFEQALHLFKAVTEKKGKVIFCGNGGSAGICSHMATDFFKNGKIPAVALNDSSALTCLGNDFGFEFVFSKQVEMLASGGDVLLAISSSGQSKNILNAVDSALKLKCKIVTFSGFAEGNALRKQGQLNFFVPAMDYGFVEVAHSSLVHALLDFYMGWPKISYPKE